MNERAVPQRFWAAPVSHGGRHRLIRKIPIKSHCETRGVSIDFGLLQFAAGYRGLRMALRIIEIKRSRTGEGRLSFHAIWR